MSADTLPVALVTEVFHGAGAATRLLEHLQQARAMGAELAVLPELVIPAQRLRSGGCITGTDDLAALDAPAPVAFSESGPRITPELAKELGPFEVAAYTRVNERTMLGDRRHSINAFFGLSSKLEHFGLHTHYDNFGNVGIGLSMKLGWHPYR